MLRFNSADHREEGSGEHESYGLDDGRIQGPSSDSDHARK